jgi:hypothetical protein
MIFAPKSLLIPLSTEFLSQNVQLLSKKLYLSFLTAGIKTLLEALNFILYNLPQVYSRTPMIAALTGPNLALIVLTY